MKTFWSPITAVLVLCSLLSGQSITVKQSSSAYVFPNGVSVPSDYPHIKISVKNNPDPGFIFINNWNGTPYMAILDTSGAPVFFRKMPGYVRDFKLQANGNLSYRVAAPFYSFFEMDSSYTVLREIKAKNGYGTDEHELQILPNGNVLLIALEWKTVDMSKLVPGGRTNATVVGNHVQEINPAGNVVFEWKCWDHLNIVDAVKENLTAQTIDYVHMNAIAVDIDSNLLLSNRHLSEITKINRKTGAIMWRLGGKNNQFTFIGDPLNGPSYQHDIRALPNGNITFMDNGNFHSPSLSRAVEYTLDTAARTATLAWQYRHSPDRYTWWMGNVQRLPNGNTLINWADGSLPKLTEVTPAGVKALELDFVKTAHSYRVFKFPWKGKAKAPELTLEAGVDKVTLIYNTFDQRPSHTYLLYIDTVPNPLRLVDSTAFSAADITGFKNGKRYYFRVTSRDSAGKESPFSNETDLLVNFVAPGENIVANGDFSGGLQEWKFNVTSPAAAVPYITAQGEAFVQIGSGGSEIWHIQMTQGNIPQVNGRKYRFEFDAYASGSRTIDARIEKAVSPYTNYSKTSIVALTAAKKHYAYDFTMQDPTDNSANIVFNCGLSDIDLFIDNVSLKQIVPQSADDVRSMHPAGYVLAQNFPNPFNPSTTIQYGIPAECDVRIRIVDILGRLVDEIVNERQPAGWQSVTWNAAVPSGIYFCRMEIAAVNSTEWRTAAARKLIVVK